MEVSTTRSANAATAADSTALRGLRVALVHDWLTGLRGGEKCLEVLCRIFPQATIHTLIHKACSCGPIIESMPIRTSPLNRVPGAVGHYRHLLPLMPAAASAWDVGPVDLVVSLSHCVAKAVRVPVGIPHVCYCFTPMRYAWDGRAAYFESWSGRPVRRAVAGTILDALRVWDQRTARRVSQFVAISAAVQERIQRCYGRSSRVIHPPVNTEYYVPDPVVSPATRREAAYLCVSALVGYKRQAQAVESCTRLKKPLVVIGEGPERAALEALAGPTVQFLGWQPDAMIRQHLQTCRALLFPGEEDFGIVPVEALACGAPVIALGRGGVCETISAATGHLYCEPTTEALIQAINTWEAAGCPHDPLEARRRAEQFATRRFRDQLTAFLSGVLAGTEKDRVPPPPHIHPVPAARPHGLPR